MNRNAYTPITADPVLLRLNSCRDWGTLHQRIRKAFGFPDYYGENWDAMWDCLTDVFLQPVQRHIVVEGFDAMPQGLRAYAAPMQEIFRRNTLGSRSHTADRRDRKKLWAARGRKDTPQGCPSCCYALIACAVEGQHTFFTGYRTFSFYRRGSAC